ncbi:hypothetical protein BDM02DRAFT_498918 [Thelephora ganbajun]|uniref:Uncharacterized protein n=1 Tax=Thelephora ganbajun TaxID=370292 RepID=A0ACB6Z863_THEGA|nr:hypothetical protein BDM02DRAFT_498918 [Thelephora ganbajun]
MELVEGIIPLERPDFVVDIPQYERDELQVEMLSETNRKRRRLERERRALERPQPIWRIPHIPPELPPPITLRDLTRNMAYAYAPGHMLGMTGAYPSLTMLSSIDVEGDLEFLNQNRRGWDIHRGPGNLQMLHHPFESYGPGMDNVPGYGILPPGQQPSTSSTIPNYPTPPHLYNQPPQQQHPIPGHGGRDRNRERDRERDREREREREHDRQYAADPSLPHPSNFVPPRSISPVHVNANGVLKATNGWMSGPGVIPADERIPTGKESRREREREEARANREERERDRERERERGERDGLDRERNHQLQLMQQQQQRHQQQQPGGPPLPQHQPYHHHHHVVHHHHPMPPPPPSSYNHNQSGYPSHGNLSPRRVARDLEYSRPRSNPPLSTEVIDLSSSSGPNKRSMVNVSPVLSSGRDQREREREREQREREREREMHEQHSRMPPTNHTRPSSRNAPSIGPGNAEHPRLPPLSNPNIDRDRERERERERDRDRERERERDRMMTPFVIPPSQATQAHFSTTPDAVPKVVREVRDVRERREPGPGLPAPEELMMSI